MRFFDLRPWPDSYLKADDLVLAGERVKDIGIAIRKLKISGGEPLMHPDFLRCYGILKDVWIP